MVITILIIALILLFALAGWMASSMAAANQAQATIEAARAAQIAAAGQAAQSVNNTILVIGILVIVFVAAVVIGYLVWRDRRRDQQMMRLVLSLQAGAPHNLGRWAPGPNAHFKKADQPALSDGAGQGDPINDLVRLRIVEMLTSSNRRSDQEDRSDPWRW